MPRIGRSLRKYAKGQFDKMAAGNLVSDQEKRAFEQKGQEAASQAAGAQQSLANRTAMAQTGGSPLVAGQQQESVQKIAEAGGDAQVKATHAGNQLAAQLQKVAGTGA